MCGFHATNDHDAEYQILSHIELHHTPESHFAVEDEDLNLALALQREEERQVFADTRDHGSSLKSSNEDLDTREEGAANSMDAAFPYAECPKCKDFVHLIEFDEHMTNHLSLQYSSDTITNMAEFDSGYDADLRQSSTNSQGLTTIARSIGQHDKKSSQNNALILAETRSKGTRLGVSHVQFLLRPCQNSGTTDDTNLTERHRILNIVTEERAWTVRIRGQNA